MTKKVLIAWLKEQRAKTLSAANAKHIQEVNDFNEALYNAVGLKDIAAQVRDKLIEVDELVEAWREKFKPYIGENRGYYGTVHNTLYRFISSPDAAYNCMRQQEFDRGAAKRVAMEQAFKEAYTLIEKNYDNVILNVQRLKDAKLGMDYLKELGFDLTELLAQDNAPVKTALAVPIDTRFLFITQSKEDTENED